MTPGTRILVTRTVEDTDGRHVVVPLREGVVVAVDLTHVEVRWLSGREGLQLMRTDEAQKWVWR